MFAASPKTPAQAKAIPTCHNAGCHTVKNRTIRPTRKIDVAPSIRYCISKRFETQMEDAKTFEIVDKRKVPAIAMNKPCEARSCPRGILNRIGKSVRPKLAESENS